MRTRQGGEKKKEEEIGKGAQMLALRFQTGGRYQTSQAFLQAINKLIPVSQKGADLAIFTSSMPT